MRVLTDHKTLTFFGTQAHLSRRQAKWMVYLEPLKLQIEYKPGRELLTADALSCLFALSQELAGSDVDPDWPLLLLDEESLAQAFEATRPNCSG